MNVDSNRLASRAKRAVAYLRVSTSTKSRHGSSIGFDQDPTVQQQPLQELIKNRGWVLSRINSDRMSGVRESRPGLEALMADARRRSFDVVVVFRFDRFARSAKQLVLALEEFGALGIDFVSCQEALDTSTPMGKAMFTIIAAMAELERNMIRERVIAGLDYAQRHGTKSGNPVGRPKVVFRRDQVYLLHRQGLSLRQIARALSVGVGTVRRVLQAETEQLRPHDQA